MRSYIYVYIAEHPDGSTYYGYTSNLENRIKEHTKNYGASISHSSTDMLANYGRKTDVSPKEWRFNIIEKFDDRDQARIFKAKMVRSDSKSINCFYKHSTRKPKGVE